MGDILRGNTSISNIYRGQDQVSKVYRGQTEIWAAGGPPPPPPSTADVWDFNANTYSGTGDWISSVNSYPAQLIGTPTIGGTTNSKYWEMNGTTDGFLIDDSNIPSKLWTSMGVAGAAIGSLEVVLNMDTYNDVKFATQWGAIEANRSFIFGISGTDIIQYFFDRSSGSRSFSSVSTTLPSTSTWAHIVMRWNEASNVLSTRIGGVNYTGTFANTAFTWRILTTQCVSLFFRSDDCGNVTPTSYMDGKAAVNRAYNSFLSDSEVDTLAAYWANYY